MTPGAHLYAKPEPEGRLDRLTYESNGVLEEGINLELPVIYWVDSENGEQQLELYSEEQMAAIEEADVPRDEVVVSSIRVRTSVFPRWAFVAKVLMGHTISMSTRSGAIRKYARSSGATGPAPSCALGVRS